MTTSTRPNCSVACAIIRSTAAGSATSHGTLVTLAPPAAYGASWSVALPSVSSDRAAMQTLSPRAKKAAARAAPMPLLAPVMTTLMALAVPPGSSGCGGSGGAMAPKSGPSSPTASTSALACARRANARLPASGPGVASDIQTGPGSSAAEASSAPDGAPRNLFTKRRPATEYCPANARRSAMDIPAANDPCTTVPAPAPTASPALAMRTARASESVARCGDGLA
mmetsp:Transcript_43307/g.73058  ORF Transcript_43307/g.73058 Transcript_43307/m.73058 type:complete len:225 (-) Transcript_43307:398-1072(-)